MSNINKLEQEVYYWDYINGDGNDVYERETLKGTSDQVEEYLKSMLSEEGLEQAETNMYGDISFTLYMENEEGELDEDGDEYEPVIDFSLSADIIGAIDDPEVEHYKDDPDLVDLTYAETPKYIINTQTNSFACTKCGEVWTEESGAEMGFICGNCEID